MPSESLIEACGIFGVIVVVLASIAAIGANMMRHAARADPESREGPSE